MIKYPQRQTGSVHLVIVIILVLIIIGAVGFMFWKNVYNKNQTNKVDMTTTKTTKIAPSAGSQYLDLPYWSIKFTLPANLNLGDVVYYKTHVGEAPEYYGFTTNRIKAQGGLCDNQVSGNLVILNRSLKKDGMGTLLNNEPVGSYYYYLDDTDGGISPLPDCLNTSEAIQDRTNLDTMVKTITSLKIDTSIHDTDLKMQTASDIGQLPTYTPASFKTYMQQLLANDTAHQGMFECGAAVTQYQVSKISQINIEGGTVPVNEKGQTCSGGAPAIWVLTPSGTWDQETLNGPVCVSKSGGLIYSEFEPQCYIDNNSFVKNPNGSITLLVK